MNKLSTIAIAAALLFAIAACARAAQSPQDSITDEMAAEINDIFDNRLAVPKSDKIMVGIYRFKDFTDKFQADPPIIRKLLFGKLTMSKRVRPVSLDSFDGVYDSLYPYRTIDELTQEQLVQLGKLADVDYVFSAKITNHEGRPAVEMHVFNTRKGILLFTPVFSFDKKISAPQPPDKTPAPNETKTKPDTAQKKEPDAKETPSLDMTPDKPVFFTGPIPKSPALDFLPLNLDSDPNPEIVFITTNSMDVLKLKGTKAESHWSSEYKKSFPRRGLAGTIFSRGSGGKTTLFVSMNVFSGAIAYQWEDDRPVRKRNLDQFLVGLDKQSGAAISAKYVKGKISFSGASTGIEENVSDNAQRAGFKVPADYLAGCLVDWQRVAPDLSTIAVVDETGRVKVFRGGAAKPLAETEPRAGGSLDCWRGPVTGNIYLLTSTLSETKDAALILVLKKKGKDYVIEKQWNSAPFDGAITRARFFDIDGDGTPEALGMLEKPVGSAPKLFYIVPRFAKEDAQ